MFDFLFRKLIREKGRCIGEKFGDVRGGGNGRKGGKGERLVVIAMAKGFNGKVHAGGDPQ